MKAGFNPPVVDVGFKPLLGRQLGCGTAGDQADGFGFAAGALAVQPGDLRRAGEKQFLAGGRRADQLALYEFALLFLALVAGAATGVIFAYKRGEPGSGSFDSMRFLIPGVFSLMVRE